MEAQELYSFLRDPRLLKLIELNKITDDMFEVLKLYENQNSRMLEWCMTPNEGHSQGDAVIKDFLEAAHAASDDCIRDNKKFFAKWTPGKIRTTSFGAAFLTRELHIKTNGGADSGRLDLFLLDPLNKILITIENKVKSSLTSVQLDKYVQAVKGELGKNKTFAGYDFAFVVLDKDLDAYSEAHLASLGNRWALLDYQWLEASANRARFQVDRGNASAQLLASYCQSVTKWESPVNTEISELSSDIVLAHPSVIGALRELKGHFITRWVANSLDGVLGELILFRAQNRTVCERLLNIRGVASMLPSIIKAIPSLTPDCIEEGSYWICLMPPKFQSVMSGGSWAVFLELYRVTKASTKSAPVFNVRLVWRRSEFDSSKCSELELRTIFDKDFPGLKKFASSDTRRVLIAKHVSSVESIKHLVRSIEILEKGIDQYRM